MNIQLPLTYDSYWTYRQSNSSPGWQIDKKVTGTDLIRIRGYEFSCFRVEWIYFNFPLDADIRVTEWIAEEGLVRRIIEIGRTDFINLDGEHMYNARATDILLLIDLDLN